jgi:hypothetical protein
VTAPIPARSGSDAVANQVLRNLADTLAGAIRSAIGADPSLEVVQQSTVAPPLPPWVAPPLASGAEALLRATSYRLGDLVLSRHLSYGDLATIPASAADDLRSGRSSLTTLVENGDLSRTWLSFGTRANAGNLERALRLAFPGSGADFTDYIWRRYLATWQGRPAFLVVESLPAATWRRLNPPIG